MQQLLDGLSDLAALPDCIDFFKSNHIMRKRACRA
jgi:hypothetical protein